MKTTGLRKRLVLTALAAVLVLAAAVGPAMSYFTTYVTAKGGYTLSLGEQTEIEEEFSQWTKRVTVANTGENPCYVRVKAFAGSQFPLEISGEGWTAGADGFYYYGEILAPGAVTQQLLVYIRLPAEQDKAFNVVVIEESTEVLYDTAGAPYADWSRTLDTETEVYNAEEAEHDKA